MNPSIDELRALLARERERQEEQRAQVAVKMHDEVSQGLTVISMELALLQDRLEGPEQSKVSELLDLVATVNQSVRKITSDLWPKILEEFGLVAAVHAECRRSSAETGFTIVMDRDVPDLPLSAGIAIEVFRLFQEMLSLFIVRTRPQKLSIGMQMDERTLRLSISASNGAIVDLSKPRIEFEALEERALWLGGQLSVQDSREGTTMAFGLAIPDEKHQDLTKPFSTA